MMDKQANGNGNSLALYGDRDDIREMADRLVKMMPGTVRLTTEEAMTIAQIAVAHELDPFNGEVWPLKGENGKWYGSMVGIKGLRKCARRQADQEGGTYWSNIVRVEPKKYNAPENAVVYECALRDTITTQAYGKAIHELTLAGIPYTEAKDMLGPAPMTLGVGIATPDEKSKMGIHARAQKRAEADAIKRRFDVHLAGVAYIESSPDIPEDALVPTTPEGVIEGQFVQTPKEPRDEETILNELGFSKPQVPERIPPERGGEPKHIKDALPPVPEEPEMPSEVQPETPPKKLRPYDPETLKTQLHKLKSRYLGETADDRTRHQVAAILEACFKNETTEETAVEARHRVMTWLIDTPSIKDAGDELVLAMRKWLNGSEIGDRGNWVADPVAKTEALMVYDQAILDSGGLPGAAEGL